MEYLIPIAVALFLTVLTVYLAVLVQRELMALRLVRVTTAEERRLFRERILGLAERRRREQQKAELAWDGFRKFVVARKVREAADVCSFYLEPHDRRSLPPFEPGQYLTFRLNISGQSKPIIRCYSLSDAPRPDYFRVTIKRIGAVPGKPDSRPGMVSSHFHDDIDQGDIVDVKSPGGQFYLNPRGETPVVLIGGGIGVTPALSMLNAIADANVQRDVWFFYGVRHGGEHIMADHLRKIAADHPNLHIHVCYSDVRPNEDREGRDYTHAERVSVDLFKRVLPSNAGHFYLCGPPPMMQSLVEGLHAWGVGDDRIHFEAFGPASVKSTQPAQANAAAPAFEIVFSRSGRQCKWDGRSTLLEMAETSGVRIDSGCRAGNCGTCITAIKQGSVGYPKAPGAAVEAGSCLACVAVPASDIVLDG